MAAPSSVIALPWYRRGDYAALLRLFSDPNKVPATYDAWLKRAESTERQLQKAGMAVARVWIRPRSFAAWCKQRNASPDSVLAPCYNLCRSQGVPREGRSGARSVRSRLTPSSVVFVSSWRAASYALWGIVENSTVANPCA
jgi:hypothetical protein